MLKKLLGKILPNKLLDGWLETERDEKQSKSTERLPLEARNWIMLDPTGQDLWTMSQLKSSPKKPIVPVNRKGLELVENRTYIVSLFDESEKRKWQEVCHSIHEVDLTLMKYSDHDDIRIEIEEEPPYYA